MKNLFMVMNLVVIVVLLSLLAQQRGKESEYLAQVEKSLSVAENWKDNYEQMEKAFNTLAAANSKNEATLKRCIAQKKGENHD